MFRACVAAAVIGCVQTLSATTPSPQATVDQLEQNNIRQLTSLYERYQGSIMPNSNVYLIPKLIHFINFGGQLSDEAEEMIATWRNFHPTWTVKVWTEHDVASFPFLNKKAFQHASGSVEKSQVFRNEILYREGGLYVDTNFECLRPFDTIHKSCEFYAGISSPSMPAELSNSLIGCTARHPIMAACIEMVGEMIDMENNGSRQGGVTQATGSAAFTSCFLKRAFSSSGKVVPFPPTFFSSNESLVTSNTYAVQHN